MTVTAKKYALFNRISPKVRSLIGLYMLEIIVILSWTLLLDAVFKLLSGNWLVLLPVSYLLSVTMLAWLEQARTGVRGQCPLEAFGLAEISYTGMKPSEWQTLRRLLATPPLLLFLVLGHIPRTGKTILQLISGTKIVPLDNDMDPRPAKEIFENRRKAFIKVVSYTLLSLMVTAAIILVPPGSSGTGIAGRIASIHSLPDEDRELLSSYLEMVSMYPDSLEFHVRLASLYYRNDMHEDLLLELEQIGKMDPNHAILMLKEDLPVTMQDLIVLPDSAYADSIPIIETPAHPDSAARDSAIIQPDSLSLELRLVSSDSIPAVEDSLSASDSTVSPDTMAVVPSPAPEDSILIIDSLKTDSIPSPDSLTFPMPEDSTPLTEPPVISPDGIVQEETPESTGTGETTTEVCEDSTETPVPVTQSEPEGT